MKKFNTFVFDLDGTLLDTLPDLVVLTNRVLERHGFPPRTKDEIHSYVGNGAKALIYQAVPEGTSPQEAEATLEDWKKEYNVYGNDLTKPYPHMVETLKDLKQRGCKLGVLSNKFHDGVTQIINQCLPGLFDVMHGEGDGFPRKPDPTGLLKTIKELDSTIEDTAYVGDSPYTDVQTALKAGVFAVGVTWGYHTKQDFEQSQFKPDMLIDDPLQLLTIAI